jgi:endonuclease G
MYEQVIHGVFSLGYDELHEVPAWTHYMLTPEAANDYETDIPRSGSFSEDPRCETKSAKPSDYTHSGFDRGHMVPAEDMDNSELGMKQSFYMSNVAPQYPSFNRGIWKKLETHVRNIGKRDTIYVYTGVVVPANRKFTIRDTVDGKGNPVKRETYVSIPTHFWKVVYSPRHNTYTAWVIPHDVRMNQFGIEEFETSINVVQQVSGVHLRITSNPKRTNTGQALFVY